MNLFGKKPESMKEQVRRWTSELKKEQRSILRDHQKLQREEEKVKLEVKKLAKAGNVKACRTMAKSVLRSHKACDKLLETSTRINSIVLQLKTNYATSQVVGHIGKSAQVLKEMNALCNVQQTAHVARELGKEMMKAGVIEEMVDDSLAIVDGEDLEEQADAEVDKVLYEVTAGQLGQIGSLKKREEKEEEVEVDTKEEDEMKARFEKLNS